MTTSTQAPAPIKPVARPKTDLPYDKPFVRKNNRNRRPKPAASAPAVDNRPAVVPDGLVTLLKGNTKAEIVYQGQTVIAKHDPEADLYRPSASVPVVFVLNPRAVPAQVQPSPEDQTLYG